VWLGLEAALALVFTVFVVGVGVSVITDPPSQSTVGLQIIGTICAAAELVTFFIGLRLLHQMARGVPGAARRAGLWFATFVAWIALAFLVVVMVTAAGST
jgi:hypothetical protein